jgi:predicted small lipoprotein YifL
LYLTRRHGLFPAISIFLLALTLGACGVKGNLESPKAATSPETAQDGEPTDSAQQKIFTSQSKVVRIGTPKILPDMPPKEWAKKTESENGVNSPGTEPRKKSSTPDKPFVLDWLL